MAVFYRPHLRVALGVDLRKMLKMPVVTDIR
jgi:hypothetical protein